MDRSKAESAGFTGAGFTGEPAQQGAQGFADDADLDGDDYDLSADPLMGEASEKKSAKGMLIVFLVVGLAAGSLFAMHTLTKHSAAAGRNDDIDVTVEKFLNTMAGSTQPGTDGGAPELLDSHQEIVEVLTNNYTENQVEIDRDPFALTSAGESGSIDPSLSRSSVQRAYDKLDLKSVIGGSRPLANVNGKIVRVNQVIPVRLSQSEGEIKFRVKQITRDSITVEAVEIELEQPFVKTLQLKRNR